MTQPPSDGLDGARAGTASAHGETETSLAALLNQVAHAPADARHHLGAFIGRFEVVRLLGQGGFGVVYEARDTELGRHVALKLMRTDRVAATDRASLLEMFRSEAEAAARLNHPNVVAIYDHGSSDGVPYLVLELFSGETLARRIERGPLLLGDAVAILTQVCRGLVHAHAAGVIHRDLKPGNVYLREDGQVKILDFGLARIEKALSGGGGEVFPRAGTPAYMAPEQWRGEPQDERTDLFPCGVMLFEMLFGRLPYAVAQRGRSDLDESLGTLVARMPGVPPGLVAITERALARDLEKRYGSAQELLDALVGLGQPEGATAGAAQPYRYLEHFVETDAPWFFGREREAVRLEQMLAARPLVALVGPSGAGKSSLVHAGLVPRLRQVGRWTVVAMRPGGEPLRLLHQRLAETCGDERARNAEQLTRAPGRAGRLLRLHARESETRVVVIVDQLEELVTQVHSSAVRRAFVQALLSVADDPAGPTRVVVALRDDFLVKLSKNGELREALVRNLMLVGPPDAEGLAEALRGPAVRLGYDFEAGLVDEMVAAVADEPAPLPLLELAASRLWERRDVARRLLTRAGLEVAGGVAGILAAHANEVLHGLAGQGEVTLARRLLCDLVTDEGTRRRVQREDLLGRFGDPKLTGRVLERLVSGRLLTSYHAERGEWVELVHESLVSGWTQLRDWLDEDRADRQFRERLRGAAALWAERRRTKDLLWRGETLDEALKWRRRYQGSISAAEQAFLSRSEARQLRARRTRRGLLAVVAAVLLSTTVGLFIAVRDYRAAARLAQVRELMRAAAAADDPLVGALIFAELQGQPEPPGGVAAAAQIAVQTDSASPTLLRAAPVSAAPTEPASSSRCRATTGAPLCDSAPKVRTCSLATMRSGCGAPAVGNHWSSAVRACRSANSRSSAPTDRGSSPGAAATARGCGRLAILPALGASTRSSPSRA